MTSRNDKSGVGPRRKHNKKKWRKKKKKKKTVLKPKSSVFRKSTFLSDCTKYKVSSGVSIQYQFFQDHRIYFCRNSFKTLIAAAAAAVASLSLSLSLSLSRSLNQSNQQCTRKLRRRANKKLFFSNIASDKYKFLTIAVQISGSTKPSNSTRSMHVRTYNFFSVLFSSC